VLLHLREGKRVEKQGLVLTPIHPSQIKEPKNSLGPAAIHAVELTLQES